MILKPLLSFLGQSKVCTVSLGSFSFLLLMWCDFARSRTEIASRRPANFCCHNINYAGDTRVYSQLGARACILPPHICQNHHESLALLPWRQSEHRDYWQSTITLNSNSKCNCCSVRHEIKSWLGHGSYFCWLDYQPLFGKGARAPPPNSGRNVDQTPESGGNRA